MKFMGRTWWIISLLYTCSIYSTYMTCLPHIPLILYNGKIIKAIIHTIPPFALYMPIINTLINNTVHIPWYSYVYVFISYHIPNYSHSNSMTNIPALLMKTYYNYILSSSLLRYTTFKSPTNQLLVLVVNPQATVISYIGRKQQTSHYIPI